MPIHNLTKSWSAFAGPLGEIIAPIIGQPDSAAAIAAARALLTARQAAA